MKASADKVFVGAKVKKDNDNYLVVKVNAKSMYVAKNMTLENYNAAFNCKPKTETFKDFCKRHNIEMVKFDGFEIEEKEASKKTVIEESKKAANTKSALGKAEKMVLAEMLKYNKVRMYATIGVGDTTMRIMERKDDDKFLINVNNDYILYNKDLDISCFACRVFDYVPGETKFPWEKITPNQV